MASRGSRLSRRHFMHTVSATLAGIAAAKTAFAQSLASMGAPTDDARFDGGYWARVRAQFMMPDGFGYLNTGRLAATPRPVFDAMVEYWRLMAVNPTENSAVFEEGQEAIRIKAAQFVGASPDEVAITRNTTEGLVTVINLTVSLLGVMVVLPAALVWAEQRGRLEMRVPLPRPRFPLPRRGRA